MSATRVDHSEALGAGLREALLVLSILADRGAYCWDLRWRDEMLDRLRAAGQRLPELGQ